MCIVRPRKIPEFVLIETTKLWNLKELRGSRYSQPGGLGAGRPGCAALPAEQSDKGGDGGDHAGRAEPQMLVEGFEAFGHP